MEKNKRLRTKLWHGFLVVGTAIIMAELAWFVANPSKIGYGFLFGIIMIAIFVVYHLFDQRWKRIW